MNRTILLVGCGVAWAWCVAGAGAQPQEEGEWEAAPEEAAPEETQPEPAPAWAPAEEAGPAADEERAWPTPLVQRPLTLPRGVLRGDADLGYFRVPSAPSAQHVIALNIGAGFGITDDLEAGILLLPFYGEPKAGDYWFGHMALYGMYRFIEGDVEVGARVEVLLPTQTRDQAFFGVNLAVPVLLRLNDRVRIDTGLQVALMISPDVTPGLFSLFEQPIATRNTSGIPVVLNVALAGDYFVGVRTGLAIYDLTAPGDTTAVPLGFHVGTTLSSGQEPLADLALRFEWPAFISSGGANAITAGFWQLTVAANLYFPLL
jgi:hypothetical protein